MSLPVATVHTRPSLTAGQRIASAAGLYGALVLLALPFSIAVRAARTARLVGRRPLTARDGQQLVEAVKWAGRRMPHRLACQETSLAAMLAAALCGRRLTWCVGVRFTPPPIEFHAWVALDNGDPVGEDTTAGWHHRPAVQI
ncbi:lasso peptide biosynthesis B2 protein [Streptomyces antimycoticus]|uniref:lasso peptide biosynthesis B2 protein n=1 Tax=Streptomyces antimycoticus TaxID=68175 RepID=UPI0034493E5C